MNAGKRPLAKTLTLKDGKLNKKRSAPLTSGVYMTHTVSSLEDFINIRPQLGAHCVCSYGVGPKGKKLIATEKSHRRKGSAAGGYRTHERKLKWRAGPSIMLVDVDFSDGVFLTPQEIDADLCNASGLVGWCEACIRPEQFQQHSQEERWRVSQPEERVSHLYNR